MSSASLHRKMFLSAFRRRRWLMYSFGRSLAGRPAGSIGSHVGAETDTPERSQQIEVIRNSDILHDVLFFLLLPLFGRSVHQKESTFKQRSIASRGRDESEGHFWAFFWLTCISGGRGLGPACEIGDRLTNDAQHRSALSNAFLRESGATFALRSTRHDAA